MTPVTARAPGRVNLIGDHTDYTGGLCLPIAIDRAVVIDGVRDEAAATVRLRSTTEDVEAVIALDVAEPGRVEPEWARYVAGVVAGLRPAFGMRGTVDSTIPAGSGLSSSAALEVAAALALGAPAGTDAERLTLARLCQAAEHAARGVPTGLLDQMASIGGVAGHGILIDCTTLHVTPVALPPTDDVRWLVVNTGARSLAASGYSARVAELAAAAREIGPIRDATAADVDTLGDPVLRARARHVVSENARVLAFAGAMTAGDAATGGALMNESHHSLSVDFESSTPSVDALCRELAGRDGVLGVRITGAGWGGCVVAMVRPGAVDAAEFPTAWFVEPSPGASLLPGGQ